MDDIIIPDNVLKILDEYSDLSAIEKRQSFHEDCISLILENHVIKSPIEQALFIGLHLALDYENNTNRDLIACHWCQKDTPRSDIWIKCQDQIGKYRVDFHIKYHHYTGQTKSLIVECDSQAFHERSEAERRYEKKRDRYFLQKDYKVFHFTGKEILDNPHGIAHEVLTALVGHSYGESWHDR